MGTTGTALEGGEGGESNAGNEGEGVGGAKRLGEESVRRLFRIHEVLIGAFDL